MEKEALLKAVSDLCRKVRQYRPYSAPFGVVEKTFNRSMGSLSLFKFRWEQKTITVNTALRNASDMRHLEKFIVDNGLESWEIKEKELGYPLYYSEGL